MTDRKGSEMQMCHLAHSGCKLGCNAAVRNVGLYLKRTREGAGETAGVSAIEETEPLVVDSLPRLKAGSGSVCPAGVAGSASLGRCGKTTTGPGLRLRPSSLSISPSSSLHITPAATSQQAMHTLLDTASSPVAPPTWTITT